MRGNLFAPSERRVAGPRPCGAVMRLDPWSAPGGESAIGFDRLELLFGAERQPVQHHHLVEGPGLGSFHARSIVAEYLDDESVVFPSEILDRVDHPANLVHGVLMIDRLDNNMSEAR